MYVKYKVSVIVGDGSCLCILDFHGSTDNGITVFVSHLTFHNTSLLDVLNSLFCHCWQWE